LQIVKSLYLKGKLSDFVEIWYTEENLQHGDSHVTKFEKFKMEDGRQAQLHGSRGHMP